jgi:hypothetical protein
MIEPPHPGPAPQEELLPVMGDMVVTGGTDRSERPPAFNPPLGVPDRMALPAGIVGSLICAIAPVETSAKAQAIAAKVEFLFMTVSFVPEGLTDGAAARFKSRATRRCENPPLEMPARRKLGNL